MLTIHKTVLPSPEQWEIIIEGARNPMNSWDKMDSHISTYGVAEWGEEVEDIFVLGPNDHKLLSNLANGGPVHAKYRRMIPVYLTLTAPLYWWKEFDTYKIGTVANSCSTMHKIHSREFTRDDFSLEHLHPSSIDILDGVIYELNCWRRIFNDGTSHRPQKDKDSWWQMIQLLPSSYNQMRTVMVNYEVLHCMYRDRYITRHKLDDWHVFCKHVEGFPHSELITGQE